MYLLWFRHSLQQSLVVPEKRKGGSASVHWGMLGILIIAGHSVASRAFCWTRHSQKHSNLFRSMFHSFIQQSKTQKRHSLAFPINTHQNANQKPIRSAPAYQVQCTLPSQPIYQTLLFDFSSTHYFLLYSLANSESQSAHYNSHSVMHHKKILTWITATSPSASAANTVQLSVAARSRTESFIFSDQISFLSEKTKEKWKPRRRG